MKTNGMAILYIFLPLLFISFFLPLHAHNKHYHPTDTKKKNIRKKKQPNIQHVDFDAIEKKLCLAIPHEVKSYYEECPTMDGWFERELIFILMLINEVQKQSAISGNIAEIGVFLGKSFIPLMHLLQKDECGLAVDCFEHYEFNRDNSGGGPVSLEKFKNNISTYCKSSYERLKTLTGDSSIFTPQKYLEALDNKKKIRIFSIDGCHEALSTKIDLDNAFNCLCDGGVVVIDDYFHCGWPGVSEGVNAWMNEHKQCLQPFLIAWNKVFFTQPAYVKQYADSVRNFFSPKDMVIKKFFDVDTLIYSRA